MRIPCAVLALLAVIIASIPLPAAAARGSPQSVPFSIPRIISREEWGADEALGIVREAPPEPPAAQPPAEEAAPEPREPSERERKCQELLANHPKEFRTRDAVTHAPGGERYLWPRQYSASVKLLVIHHTGESEHPEREREDLTSEEHVRAIYQWHTVHNGWGDIGYHYLIDKEGRVYEGRAGGPNVVGAHTYCANTGTLGIALLGNFLREVPTEGQLRSLRFLIAELAEEYGMDPRGTVTFHGGTVPTIVAHRDVALNRTACAGDLLEELLPEIRRLVALRDFRTTMLPLAGSGTAGTRGNTLTPLGSTRLRLPPRGTARIQLTYRATDRAISAGETLALVERSDEDIALWQQRGEKRLRIRKSIVADEDLRKGDSALIALTVLAPRARGTFTLRVGPVTYTLEMVGRLRPNATGARIQ